MRVRPLYPNARLTPRMHDAGFGSCTRAPLASASVLLVLTLAGCPTPPSLPPLDAVLRDSGPRDAPGRDTPGLDAAMDAAGLDAPGLDAPGLDAPGLDAPGLDAPAALDAPIPDTSNDDVNLPWFNDVPLIDVPPFFDAGPPDTPIFTLDAGPCTVDDGGGFDFCACGIPRTDCSAASCAAGEVCLSDVCGMHCVASGGECTSVADCPSGSLCVDAHCARPGGGCGDSRDCPDGFACIGSVCSDRRLACGSAGQACPFGFACDSAAFPFYCERVVRRCTSSVGCEGLSCIDVDGDGTRECQFFGPCRTHSDCAGDLTCESRPEELFAGCGRHGVCASITDCPSGMECRDLWGDGVSECVEPGGCANTAACTGTAVCATPATGGPPACIEQPI